jgi:hypothetical protein
MPLSRRDLLRSLLALPAASLVDWEQVLWVPRPMIVVPARDLSSFAVGDLLFMDRYGWYRATGNLPLKRIVGVWDGQKAITHGLAWVRMEVAS